MHKQVLKVKHYVSDNQYCEQCRFCKIYKGGQTCLLSNTILQRDAFGIMKHKDCLSCKRGAVEDVQPELTTPKVIARTIVGDIKKSVRTYISKGFPIGVAYDLAMKDVMEASE